MLNATQRTILDALIEPMLDDIKEQPRDLTLAALAAVTDDAVFTAQQTQFDEADILPTIEHFRRIYQHPHPQNRAEGSPYVGQESGWVVYEPNGHGNGVVRERMGLLGLTGYNDATAEAVTRDDVITYLDQKFAACRTELQQAVEEIRNIEPPPAAAASVPLPAEANIEPSAPPPPAIVLDPVVLFTQTVGAFIVALRLHLQDSPQQYDVQAANTFAAAVLHAIRRNHWEDLCRHPENHGIPNHPVLLDFLITYVAEHPYLAPSHLFHAASRQVEHRVLAAGVDAPIGGSLGAVAAGAGVHAQPVGANVPLAEVTEAMLVQTVLDIVDALSDVNASFAGFEAGAASSYVATWLRHIRKGALAQLDANPEDNGVPVAVAQQLRQQLARHPELNAVSQQHANFCHQQLEKPLKTNDVREVRALLPAAAVAAV